MLADLPARVDLAGGESHSCYTVTCVSFSNNNSLHLYKSNIVEISKFLCNISADVSLFSCRNNFNNFCCIVFILYRLFSEQIPNISIPYLI